jgi:alpha-tubulin suppressor-like RCC1 family protein
VFAFGWAEDGQLGLPAGWVKDSYMSYAPRQVVYLKHKKTVRVAAGAVFSAAVTDTGEVFVWGNGEAGQLGLGSRVKNRDVPSQVTALQNEVIVDVVCGEAHLICVSKAGTLYGWGQGFAGVFEDKSNSFPYGSDLVCYLPRRLGELDISHRIVIT